MKRAAHLLRLSKEDNGKYKPHTHGVEYFSLKRLVPVGGGALWLSTRNTAPWWSDYVEAMMYILNERPSVPPLSLLTGMQESISLDKCNQCRKYGYERLDTVVQYLAHTVDETVSKACKPLLSA